MSFAQTDPTSIGPSCVAVHRHEVEELAVKGPKDAVSRVAQADSLFEHGIEHRREVARRGIDDL